MPKSANQKLKLLYISKFLHENTDEAHGITVKQIIDMLAEYDISAERKSVYQDIEELKFFGLDIVREQVGREVYYSLASRDFELPELKLLVDSVQSAKFIPEEKSRELIKKLESLTSIYESKQLHRQVILSGRVKTMNKSVMINVDQLHMAIGSDMQIRFHYFQWNVKKEMVFRRDGAWYEISPWALLCEDGNYYLVGYDAQADKMKHYRVDKMKDISLISDRKREGREVFDKIDLPSYSRSHFGMYGGEEVRVTLRCRNDMAGAIIDRFGKEVSLIPADEGHFTVSINVRSSDHFIGWVISLGGVTVTAPQKVVDLMRDTAKRLSGQYLE